MENKEIKTISKEELNKSHKILKALTLAANKAIFNPENKKALEYAQNDRKMTKDVINSFKIGFIPLKIDEKIENLFSYKMVKNACPDIAPGDIENILIKNGIIRIFESKDGRMLFKDVFGDRMLLPFMDKNDNIIGFTSRRIDSYERKDYESPKYMNSPESDVFHKREMFFNYDNVKELTKNTDYVVVCEGTLDAIAYYKADKIPAVAGSGIAISEYQCQMIKDLGIKKVILSYDNDDAGMDAMLRNYEMLQQFDIETKFIDYKNNQLKDIDEIVNNKDQGPKAIHNLINNATDEISFLLKYFKFKVSHIETKNEQNNSKTISYKKDSELSDLDKFNIIYNTFAKYYEVHSSKEDPFKIPMSKYNLLQNKLISTLNISSTESKQLIYSFITLAKSKNITKVKKAKFDKSNQIKPKWDAFENEETIHAILDILGADRAGRRGFYKSLWNNDSNPSLSVKRGQNLWKDFSSGYGGGAYQLVGYLDLSDPDHPVVTDNPKQTTHTQAYNWLIKVMNSNLKPTTSVDNINAFALAPEEKERINIITEIFKTTSIIACDKDKDSQYEAKQKLMKIHPEYFELPECKTEKPPFLTPVALQGCSLPIYDVALMNMSEGNKFVSVNKESKIYPFNQSMKNEQHCEILFKQSPSDFLASKKDLLYSTYLIPEEPKKDMLVNVFKNKYKTFNLIDPSDEFIKNNFEILTNSKKEIFINGKDLYKYCAEKKLIRFTIIAQQLGKNNKTNINKNEILKILNKSSKASPDYFTKVFKAAIKGTEYPPR